MASYQLIRGEIDDQEGQDVVNNKKYFIEEVKVSEDAFHPRPEAIQFQAQVQNEAKLRDFIDNKFASEVAKSKKRYVRYF